MSRKLEIKLPPEAEAAFDALEAGGLCELGKIFKREDGVLYATFKVKAGASAFVEHHKCGITSVLINLAEKSDYCARVGTHPGDYECFEVLDEAGNYRKSLYVPTGRLAPGVWADTRNKDQHVFYHIPLELLKERIPA